VRFELGHANNVKVLDPSPADVSTQPGIVMIGRVRGSPAPARGKPLLGRGDVVLVVDPTPVVVTDERFPPPPEHAVTQRTKANMQADERSATASV
jgi:hypothetical protein